MRKMVLAIAILIAMTGCSREEVEDKTVPPVVPTRQIQGSTFPTHVGGYTALGAEPSPLQRSVTYSSDLAPLDLVVVTSDQSSVFLETNLSNDRWYGVSRCGILWESDGQTTPKPTQVGCVTVLTDGVMTTVSGGSQSIEDIAALANSIYEAMKPV